MIDFVAARRMMVDGQVRTADVTDPRLISAMLELPREQFFPEEKASLAYLDIDVPVSSGQPVRRLLKPMVLAKLIQAAEIAETSHVLDVGCATGYATALLAQLAASVVGLEEDASLARQAAATVSGAKAKNAKIVTGPLAAGWAAEAPYDVILLEGATEVVPAALMKQLKVGGRLACILGHGPGKATIYERTETDISGRAIFDAAASVLPGFVKPPEFVF
ncbi:protein-L-isoaspartate O-methyltransferase family protein [Rhodoplanes sp. Z2-YC6860]|uniref:protein-L-isoaspartate O-methyltransferase family protein n=1 Tax=Rhodoplanes sp. Z2-YC6860 TaxID=674703 RepID=UPI00078BDEC8|nr:protein-L-isoaspartate O-methyltransferase [Rhodoplanes sp. Z2-YC6860]AMN41840.1 protein-L-isoaspartate(D-aspartate) O-methyltransferase [Rhodoplanes sp. Z2-YC6860]